MFYRSLAGNEGAVVASHVAPVESWERDFTAVAEAFVRVPYLWGGRTSLGIDCSALVQLALMMAGRMAPRDTDMQAGTLGEDLVDRPDAGLRRGDLIFWSGHVGILTDPQHLVHASGHHMAVVREPLGAVLSRMARSAGQPTTIRRVARSSE
jgi:cell wall-associated NlpC family hydrolase